MSLSQLIVVSWVQFAVAAVLVLSLTQIVVRRFAQPANRIRLTLLALVAVLAIPVFTALGPWPAWRLNWISPLESSKTSRDEASIHNVPPAVLRTQLPQEELVSKAASDLDAPNRSVPTTAPPRLAQRGPGFAQLVATINPWNVAAIAIATLHGWAIAYLLLEWAIGYVMLRRLRRAATPATSDLDSEWDRATQGRGKSVRLLVSHSIDTPLTFGWFRPIVLLPSDLVEKGGISLSFCLAHEWSHIERGDILAWNFVRACQAFLWFVPSYWALRKEVRLSQDMLADDLASGSKADAVEYSELLLSFAKRRIDVPSAAALTFLHHPSQLGERIKMLLIKSIAVRARCSWRFSLAAGLGALLLAVAFSAVRLDATRADDKEVAAKASEPANEENKEEGNEDPTPLPTGPLKFTCQVVDKETGKGLPNARVVVRSYLQSFQLLDESKYTTDAEGNYVVEFSEPQVAKICEAQAADPFPYTELRVEHDDYATSKRLGSELPEIVKDEKSGKRPFFERTELFPGEPVTGTIVSPEGKPLAGVIVSNYWVASPRDLDNSSFSNTRTDADGRFRINFNKGVGDGVLWIIPKDFAIIERYPVKGHGDLGTIKLTEGVRARGRVVSADGKPIAGTPVHIYYSGQRKVDLGVSSNVYRGTLSDSEGRFEFDPLPPGDYSITARDHFSDPITWDLTKYKFPGVFITKKLALLEGIETAPVELQAVPHVVFNAQWVDSAGNKTTGHAFTFFGDLDGTTWHSYVQPDKEGTVALMVPHGLQKTIVNLNGAYRYRRGKGQPLDNHVQAIRFGTLNDDVEGIEIVRYKSPVVAISAVDEAKKPIKDLRVAATYPWGRQDYVLEGEMRSDLYFLKENDGRYRTAEMLPDEEITFTVKADGYEAVSEKINLPEGGSKDLVVTLKKSEGGPAATEKKVAPTPPAANSKDKSEAEAPKADKPAVPAKEDKKDLAAAPTGTRTFPCRIVDKETGKGVPGVRVIARQSISSLKEYRVVDESKHVTDAEGNYVIDIAETHVANPDTQLELEIAHDDYVVNLDLISSLAEHFKNKQMGRPNFERIELLPGEAVTGTIVSPEGKPVAGLEVKSQSFPPGNVDTHAWSQTVTDAEGKFRISVCKGATDAYIRINSKDFAVLEKYLANKVRDLGKVLLSKGVRVSGRILDADEKPAPGVTLDMWYTGDREGDLLSVIRVNRQTIADAQGRFEFDPVMPGDYQLRPMGYSYDLSTKTGSVREISVFLDKKIRIDEGNASTVLLQAIPHVVLNAQLLDSSGNKSDGKQRVWFDVMGRLDGPHWGGQTRFAQDGTATVKAPHGLQETVIQIMTFEENEALRYRRGPGQPLQNFDRRLIPFGTLNADLEGFEVVRYQSPTVLISAVDEANQPIKDFRVTATYPWGKKQYFLEGELRSDIPFERQDDGRRRTSGMVPDEDATFTVMAEGYEAASEKLNLKEGASKDLVLTLKKSK